MASRRGDVLRVLDRCENATPKSCPKSAAISILDPVLNLGQCCITFLGRWPMSGSVDDRSVPKSFVRSEPCPRFWHQQNLHVCTGTAALFLWSGLNSSSTSMQFRFQRCCQTRCGLACFGRRKNHCVGRCTVGRKRWA